MSSNQRSALLPILSGIAQGIASDPYSIGGIFNGFFGGANGYMQNRNANAQLARQAAEDKTRGANAKSLGLPDGLYNDELLKTALEGKGQLDAGGIAQQMINQEGAPQIDGRLINSAAAQYMINPYLKQMSGAANMQAAPFLAQSALGQGTPEPQNMTTGYNAMSYADGQAPRNPVLTQNAFGMPTDIPTNYNDLMKAGITNNTTQRGQDLVYNADLSGQNTRREIANLDNQNRRDVADANNQTRMAVLERTAQLRQPTQWSLLKEARDNELIGNPEYAQALQRLARGGSGNVPSAETIKLMDKIQKDIQKQEQNLKSRGKPDQKKEANLKNLQKRYDNIAKRFDMDTYNGGAFGGDPTNATDNSAKARKDLIELSRPK